MYIFNWDVLALAIPFIGAGIPMSLLISIGSLILGILIGVPFGILRTSPVKIVTTALGVYVEVFRNVPVLVQVVWIYYVLPIATGINLPPVVAGIIALGLNTGAFFSEIIRGGILGLPVGQQEAASVLGFRPIGALCYIILPQVLRKMLAPFLNQFIVLIKESSLVVYIGVVDILGRGDMISTQFARPLEAYTVVALWYFVLCFLASQATRRLERRLAIPE
ncbi:Amino acid ABC transporter membrane protein, PAAT family [Hyphomicrobiales bacterium]|nr:Amino acid ABC transporter membrane protein, PAAT family [Hyphomicrobiales bacterium]CAH1671463.1 Amino acid ABC transporter membrane protein, PAAT family [Hyphomicrobiales bacterium]